ncbi:DUF2812 domain-containing protein [Clostridium disporicum]|uniref:DUF2812 domain-containing protein n=1 Tax=Clostridium disporicum TaxID=84024 RepID=UPI0028FFBEBD|nr:DUF2812 domain-containing protein [Clostridium celatum]
MGLGKTKWILFKFLPYEYRTLEKYLEKMALEGWKLENMRGYFLKFKKIEGIRLKYSVDVMDKVSFFDGKDCSTALEFREYCKEAGWDFICESDKIQIYCSKSEEDNIPIHTDEKEKYDSVFKASLKYVLLNIFIISLFLFTQYTATIGSYSADFLADDFRMSTVLIICIWAIEEFIGLINFIVWAVKGKINLKKGEPVQYKCNIVSNINLAIDMLMVSAILLYTLYFMAGEKNLVGKLLVLILPLIIVIFTIMNFISQSKYTDKKKRAINIISFVVITFLTILIVTRMVLGAAFYSNEANEKEYLLTLEDFNDESKDDKERFIIEDEGILASTLLYVDDGKNGDFNYQLFQSKYNWAVDYCFNKNIENVGEGREYLEIDTDLPSEVKVYKIQEIDRFMIVSSDKIIEFAYDNKNFTESELLNKVYEEVFVDKKL